MELPPIQRLTLALASGSRQEQADALVELFILSYFAEQRLDRFRAKLALGGHFVEGQRWRVGVSLLESVARRDSASIGLRRKCELMGVLGITYETHHEYDSAVRSYLKALRISARIGTARDLEVMHAVAGLAQRSPSHRRLVATSREVSAAWRRLRLELPVDFRRLPRLPGQRA